MSQRAIGMMSRRPIRRYLLTAYVILVYAFLLLPPLYAIYVSFFPIPSPTIVIPEHFTVKWFGELTQSETIVASLETSVIVATTTAILATLLSLLISHGYLKMKTQTQTRVMGIIITPILIPGVVFGLALLAYSEIIGFSTSITTMIIATLLWSLPFATLIMLTSLSNFSKQLRSASYDLGASQLYTFRKIELPVIFPGLMGAFIFSFLLSFNEYIRSEFVSGTATTLPMFMYGSVSSSGIPPEIFALQTILLIFLAGLILLYLFAFERD